MPKATAPKRATVSICRGDFGCKAATRSNTPLAFSTSELRPCTASNTIKAKNPDGAIKLVVRAATTLPNPVRKKNANVRPQQTAGNAFHACVIKPPSVAIQAGGLMQGTPIPMQSAVVATIHSEAVG